MEDQDQLQEIFIPYTYTYDQFTVFFYGDRVFVGEKSFPIGQCTVDMMNLSAGIWDEIDRRVQQFLPAAQQLLSKKTDSVAASAQEKLNAVWDVIFTLPVYRDLRIDKECSYHALENLLTERGKWTEIQMPGTEGHAMYLEFLEGLSHFTDRVRRFQGQIAAMTELYFEPLKRRNSAAYAEAYSRFYGEMITLAAQYFCEDFDQSIPVEVSFVPMMHPTEKGQVFVAEKNTFNYLLDFLSTEFYRGLAIGNAPRRCHNCGKYFLLTAGYNTCYCNNIAPGETDRTCRKVGAHRKEAQGKANRTPAQVVYDRTYNRLKQRKNRKKITVDEWNAAVAKAQELMEQSGCGKLSDEELEKLLDEL